MQRAAAPHNLRFGPDPSTGNRVTLGGMIGNNACGTHSVAWGTTAQSVEELVVRLIEPPRAVGLLVLGFPDAPAAADAGRPHLVVAHGGSLSAEPGDGRARSELLNRMYPLEVLDLFARFKSIFDPTGMLNPGVLVAPRPLDAKDPA